MDAKSACENKSRHLNLAGIVKGVHANLRRRYQQSPADYQKIWDEHCQDKDILGQYANAMHHLATEIWTKNPETRIHWCRKTCIEYFHHGGMKKAVEKEERRRHYHSEPGYDRSTTLGSPPSSVSLSNSDSSGQLSSLGQGLPDVCGEPCHPITEAVQIYPDKSFGCHGSSLPEMPDSSQSTEDVIVKKNLSEGNCSSVLESDMIFGLPDGSFENLSKTIVAEHKPRLYNTIILPFDTKIRLLDVGSCYNPFIENNEFVSIGIDISPAVDSVYQCDFLSLETLEPLQLAEDSIGTFVHNLVSPVEKLPRESFHVVVFSLLLEYFPSPYQRWLCCKKAHELLLFDGLLLIITPDSHGQHRNAPMMKSWKKAIESMGFKRWKYVKLEHLHCMAFRKVADACGDTLVSDVSPDMLFIPQDSSDMLSDESSLNESDFLFGSAPRTQEDDSFIQQALLELPDSYE